MDVRAGWELEESVVLPGSSVGLPREVGMAVIPEVGFVGTW